MDIDEIITVVEACLEPPGHPHLWKKEEGKEWELIGRLWPYYLRELVAEIKQLKRDKDSARLLAASVSYFFKLQNDSDKSLKMCLDRFYREIGE